MGAVRALSPTGVLVYVTVILSHTIIHMAVVTCRPLLRHSWQHCFRRRPTGVKAHLPSVTRSHYSTSTSGYFLYRAFRFFCFEIIPLESVRGLHFHSQWIVKSCFLLTIALNRLCTIFKPCLFLIRFIQLILVIVSTQSLLNWCALRIIVFSLIRSFITFQLKTSIIVPTNCVTLNITT